jgi:hypothetical protein
MRHAVTGGGECAVRGSRGKGDRSNDNRLVIILGSKSFIQVKIASRRAVSTLGVPIARRSDPCVLNAA